VRLAGAKSGAYGIESTQIEYEEERMLTFRVLVGRWRSRLAKPCGT
jgi:hypothetical protein